MPEDRDYITKESSLTAVADALRAKGKTSADLTWPDGYITAIENIPQGAEGVGRALMISRSTMSARGADAIVTSTILPIETSITSIEPYTTTILPINVITRGV